MKRRLVRIAAAARSGTLYIAGVLRRVGLKVGHEYVGEAGTSSHFFVSSRIPYPVLKSKSPPGRCVHVGERPQDFSFDHVFHQVRHPLKVVDSLRWTGVNRAMLAACNIADMHTRDSLSRAVRYCYGWNLLCESQAEWMYRIEDIDVVFPEMCNRLGIEPRPVPSVSRTTHHSRRWLNPMYATNVYATKGEGKSARIPYPDKRRIVEASPCVSWGDMERAEPEYTPHLKAMAVRYGYAP